MLKIAPTKSNLLKTKESLKFSKLGYELLDQKRSILISELLATVDHATLLSEQFEKTLQRSRDKLKETIRSMGLLKTYNLSTSVSIKTTIQIKSKKIMGVHLPKVITRSTGKGPFFSPEGTTIMVEEAVNAYKEALEQMGEIAELKISIFRLAKEIKKTIKKVNALEKIVIPEQKEMVKLLQERLEEQERENFIVLKSIKKNLERQER